MVRAICSRVAADGDVSPSTWQGQLFGAIVILCGVIFLAMPLAIVGRTFTKVRYTRATSYHPVVLPLPPSRGVPFPPSLGMALPHGLGRVHTQHQPAHGVRRPVLTASVRYMVCSAGMG